MQTLIKTKLFTRNNLKLFNVGCIFAVVHKMYNSLDIVYSFIYYRKQIPQETS